MEATATRRAGLERFTFPAGSTPYFVLDLANDLPNSFAGGTLDIDVGNGRITIGGLWGSRYVVLIVLRRLIWGFNLLHFTALARVATIIRRSHAMTS